MKTCSNCKLSLDESEFAFSNKAKRKLHNYCRSCQKTKRKNCYQAKRTHFIALSKISKQNLRPIKRDFVSSLKEGKPCADCGKVYPSYVMDFDHLPEFKKLFQISKYATEYSKKKILEEVAKCEIVCANCHRIRSWNRLNKVAEC